MPTLQAKRFARYHLPAIAYALIIFIVSSLPLTVPSYAGKISDKLAHLAEYFLLGWLLARSFKNASCPALSRTFLLAACVAGSLYGLSDEIHQYFVPLRSCEASDLLIDCIGTFLGAYSYTVRLPPLPRWLY